MIIDNLKEFIAKFTKSHRKNNDCGEENFDLEEKMRGNPECKEEIEDDGIIDVQKEPFEEHLGGIPDYNDERASLRNLKPEDEIDEPTPCVYGPPSWYGGNGNLNPNNPDAKRFIDEIEAIEERNRKRAELRKLRQMEIQDSLVNKPQPKVYGPKP